MLVTFIIALISGCVHHDEDRLRVAVSANAQFAIDELADAFEKHTGQGVDLIIGSSGKLSAQIVEGAPYDVFISADIHYPRSVCKQIACQGSVKEYARGKLILWSMKSQSLTNIDALLTDEVERIAIPKPKTAPYGTAAMEVLQSIGFYEKVKDKLVFGENVAQCNQFIHTGAVDVGFTALATAMSSQVKPSGYWTEVSEGYYEPTHQGIVVSSDKKGAKAFASFLESEKGKNILKANGYIVE